MTGFTAYLRRMVGGGLSRETAELLLSRRAARDVEPELAAVLEEVRSIAVIDQPLPWMSSRLAATQMKPARGRERGRRIGTATASMAFLLAMSSVAMANSAYPGHVLYGFDRALERIGIGDGGSPERLAEIEKLAANGDFDSMEGLVDEILTTARSVADGINPETLTARTDVIVPIGPTAGAGNSVGDGETSPQPIPSNEDPGFGPGEIGNGGSADPAPGHPSVAGNVTQQTPSEGASQTGPPANEGSQNGSDGPDAPPSGTGQAEPRESPEHSNAGGSTDTTPGPPEHSNAGGNTDTTPGPPDHSNAGGNTDTPPGPPAD